MPLPKKTKEMKLGSHFSASAFTQLSSLANIFWWHNCVAFLFLTLIFKDFQYTECAGNCLLLEQNWQERTTAQLDEWVLSGLQPQLSVTPKPTWALNPAEHAGQMEKVSENTDHGWSQGLCKLGCLGVFPARCCVYVDLCFSILETFHFIPRNLFHVKSLD